VSAFSTVRGDRALSTTLTVAGLNAEPVSLLDGGPRGATAESNATTIASHRAAMKDLRPIMLLSPCRPNAMRFLVPFPREIGVDRPKNQCPCGPISVDSGESFNYRATFPRGSTGLHVLDDLRKADLNEKRRAMFAVVRTGGKQYRVAAGDKIVVEKLAGEAGDKVTLDDVLFAGEGSDVKDVSKLTVAAEIIAQAKGEKVIVFKKRRRHNYRRRNGHRQNHTILKIVSIA
jgi:large subunit ribosomal protein L21